MADEDKKTENALYSPDDTVEVVDNRIYFHADVYAKSAYLLTRALHDLDAQNAAKKIRLGISENIPIYIYMQSRGGFLNAGLAMLDAVRATHSPVVAVVSGAAASAATFCVVGADHRIIQPHAKMMIHQGSGGFWGTMENAEDWIKNLRQNARRIKDVYRAYTKVPKEELDSILKHDLWWDPNKCVKYGLVDEVADI